MSEELGGQPVDDCSDEESIFMYSEDEMGVKSEDEYVLYSLMRRIGYTSFFSQLCACEGRAHARSCPMNPRNREALSSSPLHSDAIHITAEPTHTVGNSDAKCDHDLVHVSSPEASIFCKGHRLTANLPESVSASSDADCCNQYTCDDLLHAGSTPLRPIAQPPQADKVIQA